MEGCSGAEHVLLQPSASQVTHNPDAVKQLIRAQTTGVIVTGSAIDGIGDGVAAVKSRDTFRW